MSGSSLYMLITGYLIIQTLKLISNKKKMKLCAVVYFSYLIKKNLAEGQH